MLTPIEYARLIDIILDAIHVHFPNSGPLGDVARQEILSQLNLEQDTPEGQLRVRFLQEALQTPEGQLRVRAALVEPFRQALLRAVHRQYGEIQQALRALAENCPEMTEPWLTPPACPNPPESPMMSLVEPETLWSRLLSEG